MKSRFKSEPEREEGLRDEEDAPLPGDTSQPQTNDRAEADKRNMRART